MFVIPTLGRIGDQETLALLPDRLLEYVWLAVPRREASAHIYERLLIHPNIDGIAKTRQFIFEHVDAPILFMLDDDLEFYIRRCYEPEPRLRGATPEEVGECFDELNSWLDDPAVGLVAISQRRGNNWEKGHFSETAGRPCRAWGFRMETVRSLPGFRFDQVHSVEDFHLALSLLRAGYKIKTTFHYAQGQKESNAPGGCSTNRTKESHDADIRRLAELHPGYVKVISKETKGGWFEGERTDAIISWQKAAAASKKPANMLF